MWSGLAGAGSWLGALQEIRQSSSCSVRVKKNHIILKQHTNKQIPLGWISLLSSLLPSSVAVMPQAAKSMWLWDNFFMLCSSWSLYMSLMVFLSSQGHSSPDPAKEGLPGVWEPRMCLAEWCISLLVASQLALCLALVCCSPEAPFMATLQSPLLSPTPQIKAVRSNTCTIQRNKRVFSQVCGLVKGMYFGKGHHSCWCYIYIKKKSQTHSCTLLPRQRAKQVSSILQPSTSLVRFFYLLLLDVLNSG